MRTRLACALLLAAVGAASLAAQTTIPWDSSGNGMLNGACSFREVSLVAADRYGDIGRALAVWGTITFDGNGKYAVNGQILDSGTGTGAQSYTTTGTYAISSAGWGYITSLLVNGEVVTGMVSQGVFIGSNTNSAVLNNFMMAVPAAPSTAGNSLLKGNYWLATLNFPSSYPEMATDGLALMSADGAGNLNQPIAMSGYVGASGSTVVTQTISGAHYSFSSGAATLSFPANSSSTPLISDSKLTYVSADGNFIVGGSTNGFDIVAGVRTDATAVPASMVQGLYYMSGLADDESAIASLGYAQLYGYYGSMNANSGSVLEHREISPFDSATYNLMTNGTYAANSDGSFNTSVFTFGAGSAGGSLIGITQGPVIGIFAAVRSPYFSGSGVYLNPTGIVNAASSSPFTAGISRGEFLTLYGTNLAPSEAMAQVPFPAQLNGVQVTINGRTAPVYYVSPGQVSVIVPYATEPSNAQIQVTNNGTASNMVTTLVKAATPGLFTVPPGGIGYGAILHADYSVVTTDHPAVAGETVLVYLTGLGDVNPAVTEGTAAPSNPTANVVTPLGVYFTNASGSTAGTVSYSGLAPGFAGLYQINVQIPTGVTSGDYYVEVATPYSYATQALIPVR